jgi:hypothetical protein
MAGKRQLFDRLEHTWLENQSNGIPEHGATLFGTLASPEMDSQHPQSQTMRAGQRVGENMSNFTQDLRVFQDVR